MLTLSVLLLAGSLTAGSPDDDAAAALALAKAREAPAAGVPSADPPFLPGPAFAAPPPVYYQPAPVYGVPLRYYPRRILWGGH